MKLLVWVSRIFVGSVFVISGLIKLNDPLGFSFKLEEYFSPSVFDMPFLSSISLTIAFLVVVVEVLLGVFLLIGFQIRKTLYALLAMLIFFGFLTFYSAYYNKVTDCGCFGDAIQFTPWQSFGKDLLLLLFTLILFIYRKELYPLVSKKALWTVFSFTLLGAVCLGVYVLDHLPLIDFRSYKVGTNIYENMRIPKGVPSDVYEYVWSFDEGGTTHKIVNTGDYPEEKGVFLGVTTSLKKKGYTPPIHDFTAMKEDNDYVESLMQEPLLLIIIIYNVHKASDEGLSQVSKIANKALERGYKTVILSASSVKQDKAWSHKYHWDIDTYHSDRTTLKTIIRSNPGIVRLHKGTIVQKLHYNDFYKLKLD